MGLLSFPRPDGMSIIGTGTDVSRPAHNRTGPRVVRVCAKILAGAVSLGFASCIATTAVAVEAQLLLEADTGKVLHAENANYPWYPASLTKLMTLYIVLQTMREGRISTDTLLTVS